MYRIEKIILGRDMYRIIGFFITEVDNPRLKIAIISLSLSNLRKERTSPNIMMKGSVTFIKFGINQKDKLKTSKNSIFRLFIIVNSLDICISQAMDTNIKKISVQDLTIWLNMYKFILFINNAT